MQLVQGLHVLHQWTPVVLHRDLKSLNFLVTDDWKIKICDFGSSREETQENKSTLAKMRGTFAYGPPEVYLGNPYTAKSDIYSLGIVFWELLCRNVKGKYERPYAEHKNLVAGFQVILKVARQGLRPAIPPDAPPKFVDTIVQCWTAEPYKRPTTELLIRMIEAQQKELPGEERVATAKRSQLQRMSGVRDLRKLTAEELTELQGFRVFA